MATNFKFNNGGTVTDFSDVFIPRDLFSGGGLWSWGGGVYGSIGDGTAVSKSSPVQMLSGGTSWKQVDGSIGIRTDGTLWWWGGGLYGELNKSSPIQAIGNSNKWKSVSRTANSNISADSVGAIKTDGTLWTWGKNSYGQLGDGTYVEKYSPVQTISGGTNWKYISMDTSVGAIKTDGTLWMWGGGSFGRLGDNTQTYTQSSPVQTISGGTNWKQVCTSDLTTAAIKTDGTLWLWGAGFFGALGDNAYTSKSSPVQTISGGTNWKQVATASHVTGAIKTDGTLWMWGSNLNGALGINTSGNKVSSPVQTISGGTNWKQVVISGVGSVVAIKTDGTLWTWGNNTNGVLGNGNILSKSSPAQTLAAGTNWKQAAVGNTATVIAIRDDF